MTGRVHLLSPLLLIALLLPLAARAEEPLYRLDIRVTSAVNHRPAVKARLRIAGPGVDKIEFPQSSYITVFLQHAGTELDGTGRIVVLLKEGEHTLTLTMDGHVPFEHRLQVPRPGTEPPAPGEIPTEQLNVELAVSSKQIPRDIVVTVLEESTDAQGRKVTRPLPGAAVYVANTETGDGVPHLRNDRARRCETGADGVATFHSDALGIGERMVVRATKWEYEPAEAIVIIGAAGPEGGNLGLTELSAWDAVTLTLRRPQPPPADARLVVRVVDAVTNQALPAARVALKPMAGPPVELPTDATGRTGVFTLVAPRLGEAHAYYRLQVTKPGYAEKWDDLPNEYATPHREPREYPVQLTPAGQGEHWTPAERAALARFGVWAQGKGATRVPPLFPNDRSAEFTWEKPYRTPDGRTITLKGRASCSHPPEHPWGPRPEPDYGSVLRGREDLARVSLAGHPGIGSAHAYHGATFSWQQGWLNVTLSVSSPWITHPTLEEIRQQAEELAAAVGDPGQ